MIHRDEPAPPPGGEVQRRTSGPPRRARVRARRGAPTSGVPAPVAIIDTGPSARSRASSRSRRWTGSASRATSSRPLRRCPIASRYSERSLARSPAASHPPTARSTSPASVQWCASSSGVSRACCGKRSCEHLRDQRVQLAPPAAQQRLVGDLLDERVLEGEDLAHRGASWSGPAPPPPAPRAPRAAAPRAGARSRGAADSRTPARWRWPPAPRTSPHRAGRGAPSASRAGSTEWPAGGPDGSRGSPAPSTPGSAPRRTAGCRRPGAPPGRPRPPASARLP